MKTFEEALGHLDNNIEAGLQPHEREFMFHKIRDHCKCRSGPFNFLEIGTGPGTGTLVMAEAWPEAVIHTYDLYPNCYDNINKPVGFLMGDKSAYPNVQFITSAFKPGNHRYNIIFIDADHIHPAPLLDCILALQCAVPNDCLLILHDVDIQNHYVCPYGYGAEHLWAAITVNPFIKHIEKHDMLGCVLLGTDYIYDLCRCLLLDIKPNVLPLISSGRIWLNERMRVYYDYKAENPRTRQELEVAGYIFP